MSGIEDLRQRRQRATPAPHPMPAPLRPRTQMVTEGSEVERDVTNPIAPSERPAALNPRVALGVQIPLSLAGSRFWASSFCCGECGSPRLSLSRKPSGICLPRRQMSLRPRSGADERYYGPHQTTQHSLRPTKLQA